MDIDWGKIDEIVATYEEKREALLMIMQDISELYNYVPQETVAFLADRLGIKKSVIYSVATFYKTLSLEPRGKYIVSVCTGTACHVRGAEKVMNVLQDKMNIEQGQTTEDRFFTLEAVRCIGCCASGPVITVNKETHGGLDHTRVLEVIEEYAQRV